MARWTEVTGPDIITEYWLVDDEGQVLAKVSPTKSYVIGMRTEGIDFYEVGTRKEGYVGEYLGLEAAKTAAMKNV